MVSLQGYSMAVASLLAAGATSKFGLPTSLLESTWELSASLLNHQSSQNMEGNLKKNFFILAFYFL